MLESENPYQAPLDAEFLCVRKPRGETIDKPAIVAWTFVFGANLVVPLLFGWAPPDDWNQQTRERERETL